MKCKVCGRNATGIHYGVLACEGCKAFYRRGTEKQITYLCYFGNKCTIRPTTRANCKSCRFQKCATLGMKILGVKQKDILAVIKNIQPKSSKENPSIIRNSHLAAEIIPSNTTSDSATQTEPVQNLFLRPGLSSANDHFPAPFAYTHHDQVLTVPMGESNPEEGFFGASTDIQILPDVDYVEDEEFTVPVFGASVLPSDVVSMSRSSHDLSSNLTQQRDLLWFMDCYMTMLDNNGRHIAMTVQSVNFATVTVFGDQLSHWQICMDRALLQGELSPQPETTLDGMLDAMRLHNSELVERLLKFARMLPGTAELDTSGKGSVAVGWKWMAFWLIHHAAFLTDEDTYVTMGPDNLRYSRYWQDMISESPLLAFVYKFCGKFREIGLTQSETYLLLAVIMFEPGLGQDRRSSQHAEQMSKLELIHRHYTDVLFDALKRRCTDNAQKASIYGKLDDFFGALRLVYRIHRHYFRALDLSQTPFRAVQGNHIVTVQEALCYKDNQEDPEEFDARSPMTYKIRRSSAAWMPV